jgi:hypothetical protein
MVSLGSAAAGAAGALGAAGDGHTTGMEKGRDKGKRRASSERRHIHRQQWPEDRSRSPDPLQADIRTEVAERAIKAPVFVEPGLDGDELGVEGRHRNNMHKLFGFLGTVETVLNNHADLLDGTDFELRCSKRAARDQSVDFKAMRAQVAKVDEEMQQVTNIVEANDAVVKNEFAQAVKGVWDFLQANNAGIMKMFTEADAAVNKLKGLMEETAKDTANAQLLQPSAVASGPKGLAFMSLRSELKKLEEHTKGQTDELKNKMEDLKG